MTAVTENDRPHISADPAVCFGRPAVKGVPAEALAARVWGGDTVDDITADHQPHGHTRNDVLVACWWQARWGNRAWRQRWRPWLYANEPHMAAGQWQHVPDPPTQEQP